MMVDPINVCLVNPSGRSTHGFEHATAEIVVLILWRDEWQCDVIPPSLFEHRAR